MKTRGEEKMKTLGNKIAELRKLKQMTQEDLAAQFNVSSQAVSKWENDLSIPDVTLLIQIADFFEVSLDDLLRQQETKKVVQLVPEEIRKPIEKLMFKLIVSSIGNEVLINLPMKLIKTCVEIGLAFPTDKYRIGVDDFNVVQALNINQLKQILELVDSGCIGTLMEIDTEKGDHIKIVVE